MILRIVSASIFFGSSLTVTFGAEPAAGTIVTFAGTGEKGYSGDGGPAAQAKLNNPFDVALDGKGNLFFSDTFNHCIRRVDAKTGIISTVAGCGEKGYSGDGGPAMKAKLDEPYGVELDKEGNLYIVDRLNYCVRRVNASGTIETIAGTGKAGSGGDGGPAREAMFKEPNGIALDGKGNLYVADVADQRVRVADLRTGTIRTFCGTGKKSSNGNGGPIEQATLFGPRAVAVGPDGNIYIVEREGNSVRRADPKTGMIDAFAGTGKKGYTGDGGPAPEANFNGPKEIDVDANGNVYVVDTENHAIRKIDARTKMISTIAGTGKLGSAGDGGLATKGMLARPHGVVVARDGAIYIGDTQNHKIRLVK
jgi:DNA-binding beta-propeller fold protein YncE